VLSQGIYFGFNMCCIPGPGKKIGRPALKNKKKPVSFRMSGQTVEKLNRLSAMSGISKSLFIERLINQSSSL